MWRVSPCEAYAHSSRSPCCERVGIPVDAPVRCSSTITAALAQGKSLDEALLWGPINSASVVKHIGAQKGLLSREALEEMLANAPEDYKITEL